MHHDVIRDAIISKRSVTAQENGYTRRFSPHKLGRESNGEDVVIGYQYAGDRPGGLPKGGDWCCLRLSSLDEVEPNGDEWVRGHGEVPRDHLVSLVVWNC
ncbi:MAG TPA: hypothetical protein VMI56_10920 [Reyranella sp.]|nr:hypothetical protein [Reyranella sp.]